MLSTSKRHDPYLVTEGSNPVNASFLAELISNVLLSVHAAWTEEARRATRLIAAVKNFMLGSSGSANVLDLLPSSTNHGIL
jgi:hypothetical protein